MSINDAAFSKFGGYKGALNDKIKQWLEDEPLEIFFETRASLVTSWNALSSAEKEAYSGAVFSDGTVSYVAEAGATAVPRLPGLKYLHTPIVILATGQSNVQIGRSGYSWTPEPNAYYWNYNAFANGADAVGTEFIEMPVDQMRAASSFANLVAKENPHRPIYLVNVGYSNQPISKWQTGASAPDMFAACKNNIEAALAIVGASEIDYFWWWQGETDAISGSETYPYDWSAMFSRFNNESWFREHTQTIVCATSPYTTISGVRTFNNTLRETVSEFPYRTIFLDTTRLQIALWEVTEDYIHATAEGYYQIGQLGYNALLRGGEPIGQNTPLRLPKFLISQRDSTDVLADDTELKVHVRENRSYRISGIVTGRLLQSTDFKFGFAGPTCGRIDGTIRYRTSASSSSETIQNFETTTWPTNIAITESVNCSFTIEFDFYVFDPSTQGQVNFQWAQNSPGPAAASVFGGSYMEIMTLNPPSTGVFIA